MRQINTVYIITLISYFVVIKAQNSNIYIYLFKFVFQYSLDTRRSSTYIVIHQKNLRTYWLLYLIFMITRKIIFWHILIYRNSLNRTCIIFLNRSCTIRLLDANDKQCYYTCSSHFYFILLFFINLFHGCYFFLYILYM